MLVVSTLSVAMLCLAPLQDVCKNREVCLRPGPKRQTQNVSRKTLMQQKRRLVVYENRLVQKVATGNQERKKEDQELYDAVSGVLLTRELSKTGGGKSGQTMSFPSMYRLALAPSHVGNETLAKLMFGSTLSVTTVRRSKLCFAACLRKLHRHELTHVLDSTGRAVETRCIEAEEEMFNELTRPLAIADAPSDADSPSDAMEVQIMPLILSLAWKWDGTPLPAFLCNPVSLPAPHTEPPLAVPGNVTNVTVKSPGSDCFVQRGMLARFTAQGQFRTMRIPVLVRSHCGPAARKNMLAGMEMLPVVEKLVRIASSP